MVGKIFEKGILRVHQRGLDLDPNDASPPPVLVMMSGFPDTSRAWDRLSPHFEKTHHILEMAMPSYEKETLDKDHRWGYSLPTIVDAVAELIEPYKKQGCPIHLVGHDWGAAVMIVYAGKGNPVDKLVLLDIGIIKELSLFTVSVQLLYQSYFAFVFLLSRFLPQENWVLPIFHLYPLNAIGPVPYETEIPFKWDEIKVHMLYIYLQFFWPTSGGYFMMKYMKDLPQLFMYGARKRVMFHSESYLRALSESQISKSVAFQDAGHWLHWTHTDKVAHEMKLFLCR